MFEQQVMFSSNVGGPTRCEGRNRVDIWSVLDPQLIAESLLSLDQKGPTMGQSEDIASLHEDTCTSACTSTCTFPAARHDPGVQVLPAPSNSSPPSNVYTLSDWHHDIESLRGGRGIPPESSEFWTWLCADIKDLARDLSESGLANTSSNTNTNTHPTSIPIPNPTSTRTTITAAVTASAPRIRLRPPTSSVRLHQDVAEEPLKRNTTNGGNAFGFFDDFDNATRNPSSEEDMYEARSSASSPSTADATLSTRAEDVEMSDEAETESWEYESWYGLSD